MAGSRASSEASSAGASARRSTAMTVAVAVALLIGGIAIVTAGPDGPTDADVEAVGAPVTTVTQPHDRGQDAGGAAGPAADASTTTAPAGDGDPSAEPPTTDPSPPSDGSDRSTPPATTAEWRPGMPHDEVVDEDATWPVADGCAVDDGGLRPGETRTCRFTADGPGGAFVRHEPLGTPGSKMSDHATVTIRRADGTTVTWTDADQIDAHHHAGGVGTCEVLIEPGDRVEVELTAGGDPRTTTVFAGEGHC